MNEFIMKMLSQKRRKNSEEENDNNNTKLKYFPLKRISIQQFHRKEQSFNKKVYGKSTIHK